MTTSSPSSPAPRRPLGARITLGLLATLAVLVAAAITLFGAWVGTSLAVYRNGPVWLVILGAVACFFLVPLAWELWANRHQKGGRIRDAILRSSFLSLTFVVILLATHPKLAFEALATRGDWFLGGSRSALAEDVRRVLHTAADGLEWLNELVREGVPPRRRRPGRDRGACGHTSDTRDRIEVATRGRGASSRARNAR